MTFSDLIAGTIPHHNKFSSRHGASVVRVLQHHHAGMNGAGTRRLTDPNAPASVHYNILNDGSIWGQVPEEYRAWTSGSYEADGPAITFEVENESGQINGNDNDPHSWAISEAAYAAVVALLADIAVRHGWGAVSEGNYQGHRQWYATACPGGNLWHLMPRTRDLANGYINGTATPVATPATPPVEAKTDWQLANEVIAGLHGSGEARRASLGGRYDAVQAEVNRRHGIGVAPAQAKTLDQLADEVLQGKHGNGDDRRRSLGSQYDAVQAVINARTGGGGVAPQGVNISFLADQVLAGAYGSGEQRIAALGVHYNAVQAEVNRRLNGGVNINQLVEETLAGKYGNGDARRAALGVHFNAVQAEINRRYS
jgi:N-acetylmuramoyl-L-alanine amidase